MPKYRVDPNDPEIIEGLALAALMVMDVVEKAKSDHDKAAPDSTETPPEADSDQGVDRD